MCNLAREIDSSAVITIIPGQKISSRRGTPRNSFPRREKRWDKNFESSARKICFKSQIREKFPSVSGIRWKFRNVRNKDGDVRPWIRLSRQNDAFRIAPKIRVLHFMAESELNGKYGAGRRPRSKLPRETANQNVYRCCEILNSANYTRIVIRLVFNRSF